MILQPRWELLVLPGCLLQSLSASFGAFASVWGNILPFIPPTPPGLCSRHPAQPIRGDISRFWHGFRGAGEKQPHSLWISP